MRRKTDLLILLATILVWMPVSAFSQDDSDWGVRLDFGYRWNSGFKGNRDLYRSQINLGEGPKLFSGEFFLTLPSDSAALADRVELRMNSWGGEPYSNAHLLVSKTGVYELRFDYLNAAYFNSIPSFANPHFEQGDLQSQRRYDTSRRVFNLELSLLPTRKFSPFFRYRRSVHRGPVATTLAGDGDEFELGSELDVSSDDVSGGVHINFEKGLVRIEQGVRWFRDKTSFSGDSQVGNTGRPVLGRDMFLDDYAGANDTDSTIPFTVLSLAYRPLPSLSLTGNAYYSMADTSFMFRETSDGSFFAFPPVTAFYTNGTTTSTGGAKQPSLRIDVGAEWSPHRRFRLVERFAVRRLHVAGHSSFTRGLNGVDLPLGPGNVDRLDLSGAFDTRTAVNNTIQQLHAAIHLTPGWQIRAGHRFERRTLKLGSDQFQFDRHVLLLGVDARASSRNQVSLDFELGRTDQALVRTDMVDFLRFRVKGSLSPAEWVTIRGSANLFNNDNDVPSIDFHAQNRDFSLQTEFYPHSRFSFSMEYVRNNYRNSILYVVPHTFATDFFSFQEKGDYGNVWMTLGLMRNSRLSIGYSVWSNVGDFPINSHRPFAEFELPIGEQWAIYGRYNYHDYREQISLFPQRFRTHLTTFGIRLAIDKPAP